jgi:hypothetical protein
MIILSAYTVETEPRGFKQCVWHATSKAQALSMAKSLSEIHAQNESYPNAFWVIGDKPVCKFYRGQRYERGQTC